MNILHVAPNPASRNGIGKYSLYLEEALRRASCEIELCYLVEGQKSLRELAQEVRNIDARIDIIHIEIGAGTNATFYFLFHCWMQRKKIPLVVTLHDPPLVVFSPSLALFKYKTSGSLNKVLRKLVFDAFIDFVLLRRIVSKAGCVLVLNRGAIEATRIRFPGVKVKYCPLPWYERDASASGGENILFYGFIAPAKGVEELILALAELHKQGFVLTLDIVGGLLNEEYGRQLDELIETVGLNDQVTFHGYVEDKEFSTIAGKSRIGVFPYRDTRSISGSAAIVEYMAYGKTVVCSDIGRLKNEFIDGEVMFYKHGDSCDLADKIRKILTEDGVEASLRENASRVLECRTPGQIAQNHLEIYNEVLHK